MKFGDKLGDEFSEEFGDEFGDEFVINCWGKHSDSPNSVTPFLAILGVPKMALRVTE